MNIIHESIKRTLRTLSLPHFIDQHNSWKGRNGELPVRNHRISDQLIPNLVHGVILPLGSRRSSSEVKRPFRDHQSSRYFSPPDPPPSQQKVAKCLALKQTPSVR